MLDNLLGRRRAITHLERVNSLKRQLFAAKDSFGVEPLGFERQPLIAGGGQLLVSSPRRTAPILMPSRCESPSQKPLFGPPRKNLAVRSLREMVTASPSWILRLM